MFLANLLLDLLFGIDRRLRERQLEIERAKDDARRRLREELLAADKTHKGLP